MGVLDFFRRKAQPPPQPEAARQRTSAVAMVVLRRAELPDVRRLTEQLPEWPCPLQPEVKADTPDIMMMNAPGGWAACALMRVPIPWDQLDWQAQRDAWRWPNAESSLRDHTAHLILHVGSGELDTVDTWLLLTKLTAAVGTLTEAAGIYWSAAR